MGIMERMRLDGKVSFVTGGARGIGKAIATAIAEAGSHVAIVDMDIEEATKTANEIVDTIGVKAIAIKADVTLQEDVDAMMATILDTFGKLDVAFCNAGICMNIPADEMTADQFRKVIDINLTGVFLTSQAAAKVMLKQGKGSIINTASMSGHIVNVPQPQCAYNASKAGVIQLTKSMAIEFAKKGVRVNSISPGYIGTDLVMEAPHLKALIAEWNGMAPMGRLGRPDELQAIAVYLAGDTSDFTTGSDFVIDGAFSCF
ncbi:SDR family oxidoreductase [Cellulosilyticum sp. I15G10I2]|uniref:SDR family oxidoreductase n=1 Tax=Cellulosilyticum sp. I15G10I2 TaxID=1892843 RepID=UPI00085C9F1D|nr:SDR family oxidoreductase [Cellulosilyticum sp. I15G10I2]